jgi:hypothetical protein
MFRCIYRLHIKIILYIIYKGMVNSTNDSYMIIFYSDNGGLFYLPRVIVMIDNLVE